MPERHTPHTEVPTPHFGDTPFAEFVGPQAGLDDRFVSMDRNRTIDKVPFLPESLLSLSDPTPHEQIQIIRRMAIRIARILQLSLTWDSGATWYESWYEKFDFDDALEMATVFLGALGVEVVSTDATGVITARLNSWDGRVPEFLLEHFVPYWHYISTANEDAQEDFEYDFDERIPHGDELRDEFHFSFFEDDYRFVDLDAVLEDNPENADLRVVAVRHKGLSPLQPVRHFDRPMDEILRVLIGVKHFFESSGQGVEPESFSIEEAEERRREHILDSPEEADVAEENYQDEVHGHLSSFNFWEEAAIVGSLGLVVTGVDEDGLISVTMSPPQDLIACLQDSNMISDDEDVDICYWNDIVDPVCLGVYEDLYFAEPEDDDEDDDEDDEDEDDEDEGDDENDED